MDKFGTVENLKRATKEELLETDGIREKKAEAIINYFKNKNAED